MKFATRNLSETIYPLTATSTGSSWPTSDRSELQLSLLMTAATHCIPLTAFAAAIWDPFGAQLLRKENRVEISHRIITANMAISLHTSDVEKM
jgi:hypothetical protein